MERRRGRRGGVGNVSTSLAVVTTIQAPGGPRDRFRGGKGRGGGRKGVGARANRGGGRGVVLAVVTKLADRKGSRL